MVEAQGMEHLMLYKMVINTARARQRQILSVAKTTNEGVAPGKIQDRCQTAYRYMLFRGRNLHVILLLVSKEVIVDPVFRHSVGRVS